MEISGEHLFDAPQNMVWEALLDPNVLGAVMPGGQGFEQTGENQYIGVLLIKVGPVQGTFQGHIQLSDVKPPESYHIDVDGKGAPGFVKAKGSLKLEARGSQTHIAYSGQAQIGGKIASVGQRLLDSSARSIIRQSLEALNEYLKVQVAKQQAPAAEAPVSAAASEPAAAPAAPTATPQSAPVPEYKPPTQTKLALTVMRDVFNDLVPAKYQPWLIGAVVIILVLIVWRILSP